MRSSSSLAAESSNAVRMRNYWPRTASTAGFGTTKAIRRVRPTGLAKTTTTTTTTTMRTRTEAVEAALPECLQHRHDKEDFPDPPAALKQDARTAGVVENASCCRFTFT